MSYLPFKPDTPMFMISYLPAKAGKGYNRLSLIMSFSWAVYKIVGQCRMGRDPEGLRTHLFANYLTQISMGE